MFRWSIDEYIASEQKENAEKTLHSIEEKCKVQWSPEIEQAFEDLKINSYSQLMGINHMSKECKDELVFVCIERDATGGRLFDMKRGYDFFKDKNKSWSDIIPYIEMSFPENVKMPDIYGARALLHTYIFFFTQYHDYEGARDCTVNYLNKFHRLRAFL